ncbi:MAG TPA: long-chain fatty acid--CoA ligase, partial [Myxococcota bacterium]|nr:long-chain fatty acid--CoA ligase [Myxococcota bacterium]
MAGGTFLDVIRARVTETPERSALLHCVGGTWESMSWGEVGRLTDHLACGLLNLGLAPGERVGLLCRSRLEWVLADLGILKAGCVTVPVHANAVAGEVQHVLGHSRARAVFVETAADLAKLRCLSCGLALERSVVMRGASHGQGELPWDELLAMGRARQAEQPGALAARQAEVAPPQLATLVYTSGTTGPPKGVMLTQANLVFQVEALAGVMRGLFGPDDVHLMCLPLSHILARSMVLAAVRVGYTTAFSTGLDALEREFGEVRPTFVTVVPAMLDQLQIAIRAEAESRSFVLRRAFRWAEGVGREVLQRRARREPLSLTLGARAALARAVVLGPSLTERFGGRLKYFISGGAPLAPEVAEFFTSLGLPVLEGYGLTENVGALSVNRPERFRLGSVGPPIPGVEVRLAADGEILARGPHVMVGYFEDKAATAEALDAEGFLHTGDLGSLDAEGFLRVTGRKKDLIVTSGGKKVSPQNIERMLQTSAFLEQAMVFGDGQDYLVALLSLRQERVQR